MSATWFFSSEKWRTKLLRDSFSLLDSGKAAFGSRTQASAAEVGDELLTELIPVVDGSWWEVLKPPQCLCPEHYGDVCQHGVVISSCSLDTECVDPHSLLWVLLWVVLVDVG